MLKAASEVLGLHFWSWGYGYLYTVETRLKEVAPDGDKIEYHDIERRLHSFQLGYDSLAEITLVDFPVIETLLPAITVEQRLYQFFLMLVLTLIVSFLYPQMRKHLLNLQRHQSGKNRIPGVLWLH